MSPERTSPHISKENSKSLSVEVTTIVKKKHAGWVEDPIEALSDITTRFQDTSVSIGISLAEWAWISSVLIFVVLLLLFDDAFYYGDIPCMIAEVIFIGMLVFLFYHAFRASSFFGPFSRRLRSVTKALSFDPQPEIPEGKDVVERFLKYLLATDERYERSAKKKPHGLRLRTNLKGGSGRTYPFDAYFYDRGRPRRARYKILLRVFDKKVSKSDMQQFRRELDDVIKEVRYPTRIFAIQTTGELDEEAIDYIQSNWIVWKRRKRWFGRPIELIRESEEGTYDFGIFYFG